MTTEQVRCWVLGAGCWVLGAEGEVRGARCEVRRAGCEARRGTFGVRVWVLLALVLFVVVPVPASAYSVLTHEACVDALWQPGIQPLLQRRYPRATPGDLQAARAYAYGGSVIQDLGYYPFGNRFFSNLVHYVRSGDFVEALIRNARDVNELAFAFGALSHYAADSVGHPEAVNPSVALMFPKLRQKYGDAVTYAESASSHIRVEFSFDVLQVAAGAYVSDAYHRFIGFQVARPLLDRTFLEVYGIEAQDVFGDEDLAISSYRKAVSELMPELTRVAWRDKREEIAQVIPHVRQDTFVFTYTRQEFEHDFGTAYRKRSWFVRMVGAFYRVVPKIGPLKPLKFKLPTPDAEALFAASFTDARARYAEVLAAAGRRSFDFENVNFDIGRPSMHGGYSLADKTYAELLDRLERRQFAGVPPALRRDIAAYYTNPLPPLTRKDQKRAEKIRAQLVAMMAP